MYIQQVLNLRCVGKSMMSVCFLFQATLREIMSVSKLSNEIPCDETFALYSSFPAFKRIMDMEGNKCIEL